MSASTQYQLERQEQDKRYEDVTGCSILDTDTQEYRDYFGVGDHAGRPVETRVTLRRVMVAGKAERQPDAVTVPREYLPMTGAQLAILIAAGDRHAIDEVVRRHMRKYAKAGVVAA